MDQKINPASRKSHSFPHEKGEIVFGRYQVSAMLTQKWHALDHLCGTITHVDGMNSLHVGVYEASHKRFKSFYANSSRRGRTAMDEAVSTQSAQSPETQEGFIKSELSEKISEWECWSSARSANYSIPARSGAKTSLFIMKTENNNVWCWNEHPKANWYGRRDYGRRNTIGNNAEWRM